MEIISKCLSQFRKQTGKKGECTIKYWACQSPKTRHPRYSRSKYYILMMTSSAKLRDKKSPYRPINRRILINKMMKHNLIIIEFFLYRKYILTLKETFFILSLIGIMSFSAKEKLIWCCKKMRWGKHSLKVTLFEQKRFNDMGHLAKREKQKVDTAQVIMKIIKVKTFVNDHLVRSTNGGY